MAGGGLWRRLSDAAHHPPLGRSVTGGLSTAKADVELARLSKPPSLCPTHTALVGARLASLAGWGGRASSEGCLSRGHQIWAADSPWSPPVATSGARPRGVDCNGDFRWRDAFRARHISSCAAYGANSACCSSGARAYRSRAGKKPLLHGWGRQRASAARRSMVPAGDVFDELAPNCAKGLPRLPWAPGEMSWLKCHLGRAGRLSHLWWDRGSLWASGRSSDDIDAAREAWEECWSHLARRWLVACWPGEEPTMVAADAAPPLPPLCRVRWLASLGQGGHLLLRVPCPDALPEAARRAVSLAGLPPHLALDPPPEVLEVAAPMDAGLAEAMSTPRLSLAPIVDALRVPRAAPAALLWMELRQLPGRPPVTHQLVAGLLPGDTLAIARRFLEHAHNLRHVAPAGFLQGTAAEARALAEALQAQAGHACLVETRDAGGGGWEVGVRAPTSSIRRQAAEAIGMALHEGLLEPRPARHNVRAEASTEAAIKAPIKAAPLEVCAEAGEVQGAALTGAEAKPAAEAMDVAPPTAHAAGAAASAPDPTTPGALPARAPAAGDAAVRGAERAASREGVDVVGELWAAAGPSAGMEDVAMAPRFLGLHVLGRVKVAVTPESGAAGVGGGGMTRHLVTVGSARVSERRQAAATVAARLLLGRDADAMQGWDMGSTEEWAAVRQAATQAGSAGAASLPVVVAQLPGGASLPEVPLPPGCRAHAMRLRDDMPGMVVVEGPTGERRDEAAVAVARALRALDGVLFLPHRPVAHVDTPRVPPTMCGHDPDCAAAVARAVAGDPPSSEVAVAPSPLDPGCLRVLGPPVDLPGRIAALESLAGGFARPMAFLLTPVGVGDGAAGRRMVGRAMAGAVRRALEQEKGVAMAVMRPAVSRALLHHSYGAALAVAVPMAESDREAVARAALRAEGEARAWLRALQTGGDTAGAAQGAEEGAAQGAEEQVAAPSAPVRRVLAVRGGSAGMGVAEELTVSVPGAPLDPLALRALAGKDGSLCRALEASFPPDWRVRVDVDMVSLEVRVTAASRKVRVAVTEVRRRLAAVRHPLRVWVPVDAVRGGAGQVGAVTLAVLAALRERGLPVDLEGQSDHARRLAVWELRGDPDACQEAATVVAAVVGGLSRLPATVGAELPGQDAEGAGTLAASREVAGFDTLPGVEGEVASSRVASGREEGRRCCMAVPLPPHVDAAAAMEEAGRAVEGTGATVDAVVGEGDANRCLLLWGPAPTMPGVEEAVRSRVAQGWARMVVSVVPQTVRAAQAPGGLDLPALQSALPPGSLLAVRDGASLVLWAPSDRIHRATATALAAMRALGIWCQAPLPDQDVADDHAVHQMPSVPLDSALATAAKAQRATTALQEMAPPGHTFTVVKDSKGHALALVPADDRGHDPRPPAVTGHEATALLLEAASALQSATFFADPRPVHPVVAAALRLAMAARARGAAPDADPDAWAAQLALECGASPAASQLASLAEGLMARLADVPGAMLVVRPTLAGTGVAARGRTPESPLEAVLLAPFAAGPRALGWALDRCLDGMERALVRQPLPLPSARTPLAPLAAEALAAHLAASSALPLAPHLVTSLAPRDHAPHAAPGWLGLTPDGALLVADAAGPLAAADATRQTHLLIAALLGFDLGMALSPRRVKKILSRFGCALGRGPVLHGEQRRALAAAGRASRGSAEEPAPMLDARSLGELQASGTGEEASLRASLVSLAEGLPRASLEAVDAWFKAVRRAQKVIGEGGDRERKGMRMLGRESQDVAAAMGERGGAPVEAPAVASLALVAAAVGCFEAVGPGTAAVGAVVDAAGRLALAGLATAASLSAAASAVLGDPARTALLTGSGAAPSAAAVVALCETLLHVGATHAALALAISDMRARPRAWAAAEGAAHGLARALQRAPAAAATCSLLETLLADAAPHLDMAVLVALPAAMARAGLPAPTGAWAAVEREARVRAVWGRECPQAFAALLRAWVEAGHEPESGAGSTSAVLDVGIVARRREMSSAELTAAIADAHALGMGLTASAACELVRDAARRYARDQSMPPAEALAMAVRAVQMGHAACPSPTAARELLAWETPFGVPAEDLIGPYVAAAVAARLSRPLLSAAGGRGPCAAPSM